MTISSTTTPRVQFSGNGVTTVFSTGFVFNTSSDLRVVLTDGSNVDTTLTITTHYTVTGGSGASGTVTMITPPASGEFLTIYRLTAKTQSVDYITNDAFPAALHEAALDRLTLISQELDYNLSRSILNSITSGVTDIVFPSPTASTVIGWNSAADALVNYAPADMNIFGITAGTGILCATTSLSSATPRTLTGTSNEIIVVNGDGVSGNPTLSLSSTLNLSGKTVTVQDNNFTIQDNSDTSKKAVFQLSGITTATTRTYTFPDSSGTIALTGGATGEFADNIFRVQDNSDATKQVALECSGITTATTRTLTVPNNSGTIALTSDIITAFTDNTFTIGDNSDSTKKVAFECSGITTATTRTLTVPNNSGTIALTSDISAIPSAASQADQETGSSTTTFVSPGRQQYHASACKAWIRCDVSGTINGSYNVTSITDTATGKVTVTIGTDFSTTNYAVIATCEESTNTRTAQLETVSTGSCLVIAKSDTNTLADPAGYFVAMFGDQ